MDQIENRRDHLILIVDDNADATVILGRLLELRGFSVHKCYNGITGLEAAANLRPLAAVLDLAMPDMDGYSLCRAIRNQSGSDNMLIVALSGYGGPVEVAKSEHAGFNAHLTKPLELNALVSLLDRRIAKQNQ